MKDTQLLHHSFPSPILKKHQTNAYMANSVLSDRKILEYRFVLLRIVSQWTLRIKQTQKLKPQTNAKFEQISGNPTPKFGLLSSTSIYQEFKGFAKKYSAVKNSLWPSFEGFTNALYSKKWSKPFSLVKTVISAPPNEKSRFFKIKNLRNFWNFQPCSVFSKKQTYVLKGINFEDWGRCEIFGTTQNCRQGGKARWRKAHTF